VIYVSSACTKHKKIKDSVKDLVNNGFQNIELSGGTEIYKNLENDLLKLQDQYQLNYLCHNYFPPPVEHFVLNLASLNDEVFHKSYEHVKSSIDFSKKLGAKRFAFHAGFFIDIQPNEIGKKITKSTLFDKDRAMKRFVEAYMRLKDYAGDLKLYIENNVFSHSNYQNFNGENLFMLTNYNDYMELKDKLDFNFLLDVAHLKVSSKTLGLDFLSQLNSLFNVTDYVHVSDNDNLHDNNEPISIDSEFLDVFSQAYSSSRVYTLEVYSSIEKIKESHKILDTTINRGM